VKPVIGLRLLSEEDFLAALEDHLVPRLTAVLSRRTSGHCMRLDDIEIPLGVRLCRRLRSATRGQVHVLGDSTEIPDDVAASSTKIVELRNPDADGELRPPLLVLVPPGTRASAEDSFGVATFEQIEVGRVYAELASQLLHRLPPEIAGGVEDLFAVLDMERWNFADAQSRCRYLLTVALNDHDGQAAGAGVFELGLIPDPDLFSAGVTNRATHNVRTVAQLTGSFKPERQRVLSLGLTEPVFRRELAEFGVQVGLSNPATWTRQIITERNNWRFFFGHWPLREDTTYDQVDIEVGELDLPTAGAGEQDAADPVLRGITGQRYLPVGASGLKDLVVPFRLGQDPRQVPTLARFRVQIMTEDGDGSSGERPGGTPTEVATTVAASRTAKQHYRARLRKLQQRSWEEGWYYVRVTALDTAGLPMAHGPQQEADRDHPIHESDRFYVIPDGDHHGAVEQRKLRAAGVTHAARMLEAVALTEGRDVASVTHRSSRWQDPPRGSGGASIERTLVCDFGSDGLVDVPLSPQLAEIEQRIFSDPSNTGQWRLSLSVSAGADTATSATREESRWPHGVDVGSWAAFVDARNELFERIARPLSGRDGAAVEGCDLLSVHDQVIRYADAYLALLTRQHSVVAERSSSDGGSLATLAELARIDTVIVALTDHRDASHEVALVTPTHPLRLLWLTTWALVGRNWTTTSTEGDRSAVRTAVDAFRRLEPLGYPFVVPLPGGRLAIAAFDLTPYWGTYLPDGTADPQGLCALLQTALRLPDRSTLTDVWSGTTLADRLERYLRQHPYVRTVLLNAVNVGRGDEIAQAVRLVRARSGLSEVGFDLRLYASDPEAPGTAEAVVELLNGDEPVSGLSVSVRARREFSNGTRDDAAHLTVLFDALSAEQVGTATHEADDEPQAALPVHGLIQEMVTDYEDDLDATVWRKRPKQGIAAELAGAEEATDLLSTLPAVISAVAATLAAGQFVEHQVPEISLALTAEDSGLLDHAHRCSDWVITVDRTLGIEFFDNPQGMQRPDHVIDYAPETGTALGHHMVVSSRSLDELRTLLEPMLAENSLTVAPHHVPTFFNQLRLLSGRLAFKIASVAANQRSEVLGLALARMYLDYQGALKNQILVPLDAHLELYRESRANADALGIVADLHRTDLALFDLDGAHRTITCRLVEVKCITSELGVGLHQRVRERIRTQIDRSCTVIAGHYDPAHRRPDRPLKNYEFANLLRFYLDRGKRHRIICDKAASGAEQLLNHLDDGYRLDFTRSGLVFDLGGSGWDSEIEGEIEFSRIGRDLIQELLDALPTGPLSTEEALSGSLSETSLRIPRHSGVFHPAPRASSAPVADQPGPAGVVGQPHPSSDIPEYSESDSPHAPTGPSPVDDDPAATEPSQDYGAGAEEPDIRAAAAHDEGGVLEAPASPEPDIVVGTDRFSPQFGIIGQAHGRLIALDLDETHTVSLFGVQGGGKSYTLGSIIECATISVPPLNRLTSPLATIVFHYSATQDYAPEFTSMVAPNDDSVACDLLRDQFGVAPRGLSDMVLLVPRDQCEKRRSEYPGLDVRPLVFSSAELQATHWRFLMGAVGNQATYIRQLTQIMRNHRDDLRMDTIRHAVEGSGLPDHLKQLALQRLDLASEYIDDSARLSEVVAPGRLIIVDLRDELIEKDEALGLFVVLMQLFADAYGDAGRFNKLVVFDEAHKYIDSPDLVKGLVESVREMRHKGMSVLVASQDPPSVPVSLIELSDHIIVHKFTSPAWLKHLQKANAALSTITADRLAELKPGEAYLWAGKATDAAFTQRMQKIRTRPRLTRHGGGTRTATAG
jgi:hypothetical protein